MGERAAISADQQIKCDQNSRCLCRQRLYPTLRRVDALEQCIERESPVLRDHELAIHDKVVGLHLQEGFDNFGKIAGQRSPRLRLQIDSPFLTKCQAAEAIPFWLILPAISRRDVVD